MQMITSPSIVPDDVSRPAVARAMSAALSPEIVRSGRSAAALMACGWPRQTIEAAIDDAERLVMGAAR